MRLIIYTALILSTGCVIDGDLISDKNNMSDTASEHLDTADNAFLDDLGPANYTLMPNAAPPDSRFYALLRAEQNVQWEEISNLIPYGPITICSFQPLYDQLLVGIEVDPMADNGYVDLIIEYKNGDIDLLENALRIDQRADEPEETLESCAAEE